MTEDKVKEPSIWKWENTAHITKTTMQAGFAIASLAGAITAILIAANVIAGPASLALFANPAGIAALLVVAVYFAAQAWASYKQMNAVENAKGEQGPKGEPGPEGEKGKDGTPGAVLSDNDLKEKVKGILPTLLQDTTVTELLDKKYAAKPS
ncbi:collagen-like protein [Wolbachia endosymbiont of Cantharis cryptica]|uniref:collagen-like triple helix repeat-containing protein n=1 Tax=Wolbachia endosymbiont of Cantharis cryptica TaxID=3066132 RepID=UPI00376F3ADD